MRRVPAAIRKGAGVNTISLCGWDGFQHYKDRDPPWVKLHRNLLTSESWVCGTDDSRLVQVASILLAARYSNAIPLHQSVWNKAAGLDISPDRLRAAIEHLAAFGFLKVSGNLEENAGASTMLADCKQVAMLETETETETEKEKEKNKSAVAPPDGVSQSVWQDFQKLRKTKRAPITETAIAGIIVEAEKAGWTIESALQECCARGWQSFKAEWVNGKQSSVESVFAGAI